MASESKPEKDPNVRMTPEQREARWKELRNRPLRSSIYARAKNPNLYMRWVRKDDPNDISYHENLGYSFATEPNPLATKDRCIYDVAVHCNLEGKYVNGDVILMVAPRDDIEYFFHENETLSRKRLQSGKDQFMSEAARHGITAFNKNSDGQIMVSGPEK